LKVLIVGSGGREHALANQVYKSITSNLKRYGIKDFKPSKQIFVTPGNGGTAYKYQNLDVLLYAPFTELINLIFDKKITLVIVGAENYLALGIVDCLEAAGILVFGPKKSAARLESSKIFAKEIMDKAKVPNARFEVFTDYEKAKIFLNNNKGHWVLKADGLCAGKGVIIPQNKEEALLALKEYFIKKSFGDAGEKLIIEEFLVGKEASILAFCDGHTVCCLPAAQDYKKKFDGDKGPNTGGMGVYSPLAFFNDGDDIKVLEFNVRFGDPECQCVLPHLKSNFLDIVLDCIKGKLDTVPFEVDFKAACTVVMASGGYPGSYENGKKITGLENIKNKYNLVFHAGTKLIEKNYYTNGGRVLSVSSFAKKKDYPLEKVVKNCYQEIKKINFENCFFRKDIGQKE
jgi:phosphoribosylamine-glycine ligase